MLEEAITNSVQVIETLYVLLTVCYDKFPCTWSSLEDEGKWNSWIQCVTQSQTFFNYTSAGIFNSYRVPLWTKFISSTSLFIENDPPTVCQLTTHLTISEADVRLLNRILKKMKSITQNILPFFMIKVMITHFIFTSVASPRILARTWEGLVFLFMQARTTIEAKG